MDPKPKRHKITQVKSQPSQAYMKESDVEHGNRGASMIMYISNTVLRGAKKVNTQHMVM